MVDFVLFKQDSQYLVFVIVVMQEAGLVLLNLLIFKVIFFIMVFMFQEYIQIYKFRFLSNSFKFVNVSNKIKVLKILRGFV